MTIWEDAAGVAAWVLVGPRHRSVDSQVCPDTAYQRRGLGKALLLTVMRQMAAAGLEYAVVVNEGTNEASHNLYRSCGFQPWHLLDGFIKPVAH